ncbi:hypothetical protein AAVH_27577 [Aphelenchoides avenae]|nr:hypothetical protein AAVH_27577 [Aphelenchus avenae]
MIGMMNCPTENGVEVYGASPAYRMDFRQSLVRMFSEPKDKPQISYAKDGRKLINGQMSLDIEVDPPVHTWNRLILRTNLQRKVSESAIMCCTDRPQATVVDDDELPSRPVQRRRSKSWTGRVPVTGRMCYVAVKKNDVR